MDGASIGIGSNLSVLVVNEHIGKRLNCSWWWPGSNSLSNENEYSKAIISEISVGDESHAEKCSAKKGCHPSRRGEDEAGKLHKQMDAPLRKAVKILKNIHSATDEELKQAFSDIIEAKVIDSSIMEAIQMISGKRTASDAELVDVLADFIEAATNGQGIADTDKDVSTGLMTALHVISGIQDSSNEELRDSCIEMINAGIMEESLLGVLQTIAGNDSPQAVEFLADIFVEIAKSHNREELSTPFMEKSISKTATSATINEEDLSAELTMALRIIAGIQDVSDEEFRDAFIKIVNAGLMEEPLLGAIQTIAGIEGAKSIDFLADIFIEIARVMNQEDYTVGKLGTVEYTDMTVVAGMRLYKQAIERMMRIDKKREEAKAAKVSRKSSNDVFDRLYNQTGTKGISEQVRQQNTVNCGDAHQGQHNIGASKNEVNPGLEKSEEQNRKDRRKGETFERLYNSSKTKRILGKERRKEIEKTLAKKHETPVFKKMPLSHAEDMYRRSLIRLKKSREEMKDNEKDEDEYDFSCVSSMLGFLPTILE